MGYSINPEIKGISDLAHTVNHLKDGTPDRSMPVYGLAVHTSGSGIVEKACNLGIAPIEYAVNYYTKPDSYSPHYVIDYDGTIMQVADEHEHAQHIGFPAEHRRAYLTNGWVAMLPPEFVGMWKKRWKWPTYMSPAHLFPGPSPNDAYVGVELLPVIDKQKDIAPMSATAKYTLAQHKAISALAIDIAKRWKLPDGWGDTGRLVGHEDINPLERTTKNPPAGWDPGGIRTTPWIDWIYIKTTIRSS